MTSNRLVRTEFFRDRVDGWLSLSGGRLGGSPGRAGSWPRGVWSINSICLNPIMAAGRTGYPGKAFQNGSNTTLHGPNLMRNVFLAAVRRVGTSPMDSARSVFLPYGISPGTGGLPDDGGYEARRLEAKAARLAILMLGALGSFREFRICSTT